MTDDYHGPERRISDDTRLVVVERDIRAILKAQDSTNRKLDRVSDTLATIQSEPQQFPAGRALLSRADANRERIDKHDVRIDSLEDWHSEWNGVWRFILAVGTVLGAVATFLSLLALYGPKQ